MHAHNYDDDDVINFKFSTRSAFQMQNVYAEKVKVLHVKYLKCRTKRVQREGGRWQIVKGSTCQRAGNF